MIALNTIFMTQIMLAKIVKFSSPAFRLAAPIARLLVGSYVGINGLKC